jgi:RNA recognition motif-containing protein
MEQVTGAKIIRDRVSGLGMGYGFVEFVSHELAQSIILNYNGKPIPNMPGRVFRLNWGTTNNAPSLPSSASASQFSLFVGDLDSEATDLALEQTFRQRFASVTSARVLMDPATGKSKGYGFVKFSDYAEYKQALETMNGVFILSRPIRVGESTANKKMAVPGMMYGTAYNPYIPQAAAAPAPAVSAETTTICVANIDESINETSLFNMFQSFGIITNIRFTAGQFAFISFAERFSGERAIESMNGKRFGSKSLRVSWGVSVSARPAVSLPIPQLAPPPPQSCDPLEASNSVYRSDCWELLLSDLVVYHNDS